jgi:hypothetical protein
MTQPAFLLYPLQQVSTTRLQRAVNALANGSMTVTLTRQEPSEVRAWVTCGGIVRYGVTLTSSVAFCSCKDALYRGVVCKHAVVVALHVLRTPQPKTEAPVPQFPIFHLMWRDGIVLCGDPHPGRVQVWPWTDYMLTWPEVCSSCVATYKHPKKAMAKAA